MDKIFMAGPSITDIEIEIVNDALRNGWYESAYDYCEKFQSVFAQYHNRKYALMTPNCTSAIHLLLAGLGIGEGDEVLVPEITWIATSAPIAYVGATPVFCDVDSTHWCLDTASVKRRITDKTRAIIVVDVFGNMPDMDALVSLAQENNIYLIEDAAEALGSKYKGIPAGKFGIGSVFSFHRTKTITTGEGGMLLIDDQDLYERCKFLRDHGRVEGVPYYNSEVAFKYMPFNVQAALGYGQFQRLSELIEKKRALYFKYRDALKDIPDLQWNPDGDDVYNGLWCTALIFGKSHNMTKKRAMKELEKLQVPSRPFFYPLSSLPAYKSEKNKNYVQTNPVAYDVSDRGINLSCALNLTDEQLQKITSGIRKILGY